MFTSSYRKYTLIHPSSNLSKNCLDKYCRSEWWNEQNPIISARFARTFSTVTDIKGWGYRNLVYFWEKHALITARDLWEQKYKGWLENQGTIILWRLNWSLGKLSWLSFYEKLLSPHSSIPGYIVKWETEGVKVIWHVLQAIL